MDQEQRLSQQSLRKGPLPSPSFNTQALATSTDAAPFAGESGSLTTDTITDYAVMVLVAIQNACIYIKKILYNAYLVIKFICEKPDVAWDLISTTFHLIKVSREAGLWSWSQLWDILYAQTIAPMIQSQKAKEEAKQAKT